MSQAAYTRGVLSLIAVMMVGLAALSNAQTPAAQSVPTAAPSVYFARTSSPTPSIALATPVAEQNCLPTSNDNLPLPEGAIESLIDPYDPELMLTFFNSGGTVDTLRAALEGAGNAHGPYLWQIIMQDITGDAIPEIFLALTSSSGVGDAGYSRLLVFRCVDGVYQDVVLFPPVQAVSRTEGLYGGGGAHILAIADLTGNSAPDILFAVDGKDSSGEYAEYYIYEWRDGAFLTLIDFVNGQRERFFSFRGGRDIIIEDLKGDGAFEFIINDRIYRWLGGIGLYFADPLLQPSPTPLLESEQLAAEQNCVPAPAEAVPFSNAEVDNLVGHLVNQRDAEPLLTFLNSGGSLETLRAALDGAGNEYGLYHWQIVSQDITGDAVPEIFVAITDAFGITLTTGDTHLVMFRCVDGVYQERLLFRVTAPGSSSEGVYGGGSVHILSIADLNRNGTPDVLIGADWEDSYVDFSEYYIYEWRDGDFHSLLEYENIFGETSHYIVSSTKGAIALDDLDDDGIFEISIDGVTYRWHGELYMADNFPAKPSPTPIVGEAETAEGNCVSSSRNVALPEDAIHDLHNIEPLLRFFNDGGTVDGLRAALEGGGNEYGLYLWQVLTYDLTGDAIPEIFFAYTTPTNSSGYGETTLVMFHCTDSVYQDTRLFQLRRIEEGISGLYTGSGAHILSIADLNANGAPDILIVVGYGSDSIADYYLYEWRDARLQPLVTPSERDGELVPLISGDFLGDITIEDLNGDGIYEIVFRYHMYRWDGEWYTRESR